MITVILWVVGIHLFELLIIGGYMLIRKNNALEKVIANQQQYIDAINIVVENSNSIIKELDSNGAFEADDEVGAFFRNLKEIQSILNQFNSNKN